MKNLFLIIISILFLGCTSSIKHDELGNAISYIDNKLASTFAFKDLDLSAFGLATDTIGNHLIKEQYAAHFDIELTKKYLVSVRIRNFARKIQNIPVDQKEVAQALELAELLLQNIDEKPKLMYLAYDAGLIAQDFSKDTKRQMDFFSICGGRGHAGCANIIGNGFRYGNKGLEKDLLQAINWHTVSFNTGTSYNCAGLYSANSLAEITFIKPDLDPIYNWSNWIEQTNSMLEKQKNKNKESSRDICDESTIKIDQYLLHLAKGKNKTDMLNDAYIAFNKRGEGPYVDAYKLIGEDYALEDLMKLTKTIESESSLCSLFSAHAFYLMIKKRSQDAEYLIDKMKPLDEGKCESVISNLRLKEQKIVI